jgi:hypothetical protein
MGKHRKKLDSRARLSIRFRRFSYCACWQCCQERRLCHKRTVGPGKDQFSSPVPAVQGWDPSPDQLGNIFATLDATIFQRCFVAWVASITGVSADVIAIDGNVTQNRRRKEGRSVWCLLSRSASAWCSTRSRSRINRTRSSPSRRFSICWRSRVPSSPSTRGLPARYLPESH